MWQVMSDLYFSKQDGFVYAPKEATGYALCAYETKGRIVVSCNCTLFLILDG